MYMRNDRMSWNWDTRWDLDWREDGHWILGVLPSVTMRYFERVGQWDFNVFDPMLRSRYPMRNGGMVDW